MSEKPRYRYDVRSKQRETVGERIWRRAKKNPAVLVGLGGTVAVLAGGIASFAVGSPRWSQFFMRWRVVLQGSTVIALLVGGYIEAREASEERNAMSHPIGALENAATEAIGRLGFGGSGGQAGGARQRSADDGESSE